MDDDLRYLVHFFNDERRLFQTLTMADVADRDAICDAIASRKGWFWARYASRERRGYLRRRMPVEKTLYDDYGRAHGRLKEKAPAFFCLIPHVTEQKARLLAQQLPSSRTAAGSSRPRGSVESTSSTGRWASPTKSRSGITSCSKA